MTEKYTVYSSIISLSAEMSVVDSHTDISSADRKRTSDLARRIAKMGKRICWLMVFQKGGEKFRPWILRVSNRQSRALRVVSSVQHQRVESNLQSPHLKVFTRHDDLVERMQYGQPVLHHRLLRPVLLLPFPIAIGDNSHLPPLFLYINIGDLA